MSTGEKHSKWDITHFSRSLELLTTKDIKDVLRVTSEEDGKTTDKLSLQQNNKEHGNESKDNPSAPDREIGDETQLQDVNIANMFTTAGCEDSRKIELDSEYRRYLQLTKPNNVYRLQYNHENIIRDLWLSLSLSLLSGEFLLYDDYSESLNGVIHKIKEAVKSIHSERSRYHPILFPVYKVCLRLREVCELTKLQIRRNVETKEQSVFVLTNETLGLTGYDQQASSLGIPTDDIQFFENLMMHIVDMTYIDISGTMRRKDIRLLQNLYEYIEPDEFPTSFLGSSSFKMGKDDKSVEAKVVCRAIMAKTSLLLAQSFYKPQLSGSNPNSPKKLFTPKECYHNTKHCIFLYREEAYIHGDEGRADNSLYKLLTEGPLNKFGDLTPVEDTSNWRGKGGKDIKAYEKFLEEKEEKEEKSSPVVMHLKELFRYAKNIEGQCEKVKKEDYNNQRRENLEKLVSAVNKLRDKLKDIIDYTSKNRAYIPKGVRTNKIEDCLFTLEDTVLKGTVEVFIASYGTPPIFIDILEDVVYPRLNAIYKKGSLVIVSETARVASETARVSKQTKELKEEFEKKDGQYISILGIFAAMIVFATTTTTIFKQADTLQEFLSVLFAGYGLTALLLYFFNPKQEHKEGLLYTILIAIALSLIAASPYFNISSSPELNQPIQFNFDWS